MSYIRTCIKGVEYCIKKVNIVKLAFYFNSLCKYISKYEKIQVFFPMSWGCTAPQKFRNLQNMVSAEYIIFRFAI